MIALAATIHDPDGKLAPAIARDAAALKSVFAIFAVNVTVTTHPSVIAALDTELGAHVITHKTGEYPVPCITQTTPHAFPCGRN